MSGRLAGNRVLAAAFQAHMTMIFGSLELLFFGVLTKLMSIAQGEFDDHSVNDQLSRLIQASEQPAMSMTIRASLDKAGPIPEKFLCSVTLRFDKEEVRENAGFKEI
jgi:hypothetical protein